MRKIGLIGMLLLFCYVANAQNKNNISSPITLDSLVYKNIQKHKAEQTLDGFRVQLFSSADRNSANTLRTKFKTEYPEVPAYLIYQAPYFKVRVGDFRNQIEAQLFYLELQKNYGQLLIVPDKINLPTL